MARLSAGEAYELGGGEQFCRVLGIPILRGRDFEIADRTRRPVPTILNETLARRSSATPTRSAEKSPWAARSRVSSRSSEWPLMPSCAL